MIARTPDRVAEDHNRTAGGRALLLREHAAQLRMDVERLEKPGETRAIGICTGSPFR